MRPYATGSTPVVGALNGVAEPAIGASSVRLSRLVASRRCLALIARLASSTPQWPACSTRWWTAMPLRRGYRLVG